MIFLDIYTRDEHKYMSTSPISDGELELPGYLESVEKGYEKSLYYTRRRAEGVSNVYALEKAYRDAVEDVASDHESAYYIASNFAKALGHNFSKDINSFE